MVDSMAATSRAAAITALMTEACPEIFAGAVLNDATGRLTVRVTEDTVSANNCAEAGIRDTAQAGDALIEAVTAVGFSLSALNRDVKILRSMPEFADGNRTSVAYLWANELSPQGVAPGSHR